MQSDPGAWSTVATEREVLAIARSVPAVNRLLDVVGLFGGDDRVQVTFTVSHGSASGAGVAGLLRDAGVTRVEPWERIVTQPDRFALTLTASAKGQLYQAPGPLLLMPHGAGYNRLVGDVPGDLDVASGLAPQQLLHNGAVVPTRIALSHAEQQKRLEASCPQAAGRGVVVGDPSLDRMLAHLGRRDRYRHHLTVTPQQRLVAISSTWSRFSLLGSRRDMVRRLLAELPYDEYRVALIAHPNVWYQHGRAQLELWFADEIEAGLRIIPPHEGWRAALVAADLVVGDHGSVTYYAAALGRTVLLAAFGTEELDPNSPLRIFGNSTRWLDPDRDLLGQLEAAAAAPTTDATAGGDLIANPGESAAPLRQLMYELLDLPLPQGPAHYRPLPDLPRLSADVTAWRIEAETLPGATSASGASAAKHENPALLLRRYPAGAGGDGAQRLLVVDAEDAVPPRWQAARAWSRTRSLPEHQAAQWMVETLSRYPRAALAATATTAGWVLLLARDHGYVRVHGHAPPASGGPDAAIVAAVAAMWTRCGRISPSWSRGIRVHDGTTETRLVTTPPPPNLPVLPAG